MAVDIGNGSRVVVTVRGAGLKGDKGDTPGEYLKAIRRETSGRVIIEDDDGVNFGISAIHASNAGEGAIELKITNIGGAVFTAVIAGGEDYIFLNNPTIYVDADDGNDAVVITEQSDLSWAKAFKTFDGVRAFVARSTIFGNITLQCRGVFAEGPGVMGPAQMKGAGRVVIRGDSANPQLFEIPVGRGYDGGRAGILVTGGEVVIRDCTFRFYNVNDASTRSACMSVSAGRGVLGGKIRLEGFYNNDRAGASNSGIGYADNSAILEVEPETTFVIATDDNCKLHAGFRALSNGGIIIGGNTFFQIASELEFTSSLILINNGGSLRCNVSQTYPDPVGFAGAQRFIAPYSVRFSPISTCEFTWTDTTRAQFIEHHWGVIVSPGVPAIALVDALAAINNVAGP